MMSSKTYLTFFIFYLIKEYLLAFSADFEATTCGTNGNYTSNSPYQSNLNNLLRSLSANVDAYGFYNASMGQVPSRVNAIVLCRGDAQPYMCRSCIQNATTTITKSCPNQRQAILWNSVCMLRYSDDIIYGTMEIDPGYEYSYPNNATSPTEFLRDLKILLDDIRVTAANSLYKVAAGNISSADFQTIVALVQCTPDISSDACSTCLVQAARYMGSCCSTSYGVSMYYTSCNLYYDLYNSINQTRVQEMISPAGHTPSLPSSPSDFIPTVSTTAPDAPSRRISMIVGIVVSAVVVILFSSCVLFFVQRRKRQKRNEDKESFLGMEARPCTFSYSELKMATSDFNTVNKLGQGGFGPVFKGTLGDGRVIAVKQLSVTSDQGKNQFLTEIATISAVQHKNLVKLYGWCIEGDKQLLVYEYLENSSLDRALFGTKSLLLDWPTRFTICIGVARGLTYLHEDSRLRIVHRDVKASNILLDSQLNPKISDFGLARLYDDAKTHISTCVAGTIGYLAPEYALRGQLTEKADVFGFGVVVLEIICGRPNSDTSLEEDKIYLLDWVWSCHENDRDIELVDPNMAEFNEEEVRRVIEVALLCSQSSPGMRPSMSRVVAMLSGDIEVPSVTTKPTYLTEWNLKDISRFSSNPTTSTGESNFSSSLSASSRT